jgi:hypothetical protein
MTPKTNTPKTTLSAPTVEEGNRAVVQLKPDAKGKAEY